MIRTSNNAGPDKCWACQTEISKSQLVCVECKSWQNWRKYLNISNNSLALILAILSVSTVLIPKIEKFYGSKEIMLLGDAKLKSVDGEDRVSINLRNIGNSLAILPQTIVCKKFRQGREDPESDFSLISDSDRYSSHESRSPFTIEYVAPMGISAFENQFDYLCEIKVYSGSKNKSKHYYIDFSLIGTNLDRFGSFLEGRAPDNPMKINF